MVALVEAKAESDLETALRRAYIDHVVVTEKANERLAAVVLRGWRNILITAKKGGGRSRAGLVAAVRGHLRDIFKALEAELAGHFEVVAETAFDKTFEAFADSMTKRQWELAGKLNRDLVEAEDDFDIEIYLDELDAGDGLAPGEWAPGRKIPPLPPDPPPRKKVRYTGKRKVKPSKTRNRQIIKQGKYKERLEAWSHIINDKRKVAEIVADGVAAGDDLEAIARRVEPHVRGVRSSAMRIARTESARIHNAIAEENFKQFEDMIRGLRVINPLDDATRPEHRKRASENDVSDGPGRVYWKKGEVKRRRYKYEERPELPDAPNCRCSYTPVLRGDEEIEHGNMPPHIRDKVDDLEHDATPEELEAFRKAERERTGIPKKVRAGVRGHAEDDKNLIGTQAWLDARKAQPKKVERMVSRRAWKKSLTKAEKEGIEMWSLDYNGVQRMRNYAAGKEIPEATREAVEGFWNAIERSPVYKGTVHRGQMIDPKDFVVGKNATFQEIVSSSKDRAIALEFAELSAFDDTVHVAVIKVQQRSGVDISDLVVEGYESQKEVLLPAARRYKVVKKEFVRGDPDFYGDTDGYWDIVLKEL